MSDEPKLVNDDAPHAPLYNEGDIVRHKTSRQSAVILFAQYVLTHDRSCPNAQPFSCLTIASPCNCADIFTGEYTISIGFTKDEEIVIDECVLEAA